jgi:hypothetical protein
MTDNLTTPIPSSTKFKTKDTGPDGHMPAHILFDSAEGEILGTKTDAASTATDATATSAMSVWKQLSAYLGTLAGAVSSSKVATKAASGDFADGAIVTLGAKTDAKSTATDTTSVSSMSVWKQISASVQAAAASLAGTLSVSQSGTWTVQPGNTANTTAWKVDGSAVTQPTSNTVLTAFGAGNYETVAASASAQALGVTGATGDYLSGVLIVPATTSPGAVSITDGSGSAITIFAGGATSVSNLVPFFVPLGLISTSGAWKVTTGTNVSCIGCGKFT